MDSKLLKVKEVAILLNIAPRTVWRLSATGELPAPVRIGTRIVRWRFTDIERHIDTLAGK